jgi:hypothetical protein
MFFSFRITRIRGKNNIPDRGAVSNPLLLRHEAVPGVQIRIEKGSRSEDERPIR